MANVRTKTTAAAVAAFWALLLLTLSAGGQESRPAVEEDMESALEEFVLRKMAEDPELRRETSDMSYEELFSRWTTLLEEFADEHDLDRDLVVGAWWASLAEELDGPWEQETAPGPEALLAGMRAEELVEAASAGDLERVRSLLDRGVPADHRYSHADTALIAAVAGGHEPVAAVLLERGADPNRTGRRGRSPLAAAYEAESLAIARRLLDAGARVAPPAAAPKPGRSLLGMAIADRRGDWIELLRAHGATLGSDEANRLLAAALDEKAPDRLAGMRLLLDLGADPDYRPARGIRPLLHIAVLEGRGPEMELLIERGAEIEAQDSLGESTLYVAVQSGRAAFVEHLLELGADPDARAKDGTTPLFAALARRKDDLARRLIEGGARVDVASAEGRTPLMELATRRPPRDAVADHDGALAALIDLLIERGAVLDAVDERGHSALSLAGTACNLTALSALARHGAAIATEAWIDILHAPCAPRWPQILDGLRAELDLPVASLEELTRGPLAPPDPHDADAQRRTLAEMRSLGAALMRWLTDQLSHHGAPPRVRFAQNPGAAEHGADVSTVPQVDAAHLRRLLVPLYQRDVPEVDGWGFRYDYRIADSFFGDGPVLIVRSPGSDGRFSGDRYPEPRLPKGLYPQSQTHRDIVWVDGRFLQAPRLFGNVAIPARYDRRGRWSGGGGSWRSNAKMRTADPPASRAVDAAELPVGERLIQDEEEPGGPGRLGWPSGSDARERSRTRRRRRRTRSRR